MIEPYGIKKLRRAFEISQEPRTGMHVGLPHITLEASLAAHALAAYDALRREAQGLRERIADAELALAVYDESSTAEYWLRHPVTPPTPREKP